MDDGGDESDSLGRLLAMDATLFLTRAGGIATWTELVTATSRRDLELALRAGDITKLSRGRYALPTAGEARTAAHRVSGVATGLSAAAHHGWKTKWQPKAQRSRSLADGMFRSPHVEG